MRSMTELLFRRMRNAPRCCSLRHGTAGTAPFAAHICGAHMPTAPKLHNRLKDALLHMLAMQLCAAATVIGITGVHMANVDLRSFDSIIHQKVCLLSPDGNTAICMYAYALSAVSMVLTLIIGLLQVSYDWAIICTRWRFMCSVWRDCCLSSYPWSITARGTQARLRNNQPVA